MTSVACLDSREEAGSRFVRRAITTRALYHRATNTIGESCTTVKTDLCAAFTPARWLGSEGRGC